MSADTTIESHGELSPSSAVAERRDWERCGSARPIPRRIYSVEDLRPLDAWILDLSCSGMALLVPDPLSEGALLFVELESLPEAAPVKVWANVVRCVPAEDGEWFVGCELVNCLSEKQLETLLI
jgi:hypothetical protein